MRIKDKIEAYIVTLLKKCNVECEVIESSRSRYFKVNDKIIRVSDHIGSNSSGSLSIIIPRYDVNDNNSYIVHSHSSGGISIMNYEEVKELVRTFVKLSSFITDFCVDTSSFKTSSKEISDFSKRIKELKDENKELKTQLYKIKTYNDVFDVDLTTLTDKQKEALKKTIEQFKMHNKK